jgi:hypothetical protein
MCLVHIGMRINVEILRLSVLLKLLGRRTNKCLREERE